LTNCFDPVLGDRNRIATVNVCEECHDAIEEIARAREALRQQSQEAAV
jgi:hypothetical protein